MIKHNNFVNDNKEEMIEKAFPNLDVRYKLKLTTPIPGNEFKMIFMEKEDFMEINGKNLIRNNNIG